MSCYDAQPEDADDYDDFTCSLDPGHQGDHEAHDGEGGKILASWPNVSGDDDAQSDNYLALWFTPDAIRDHFDADDEDPTTGLTDEQLRHAGEAALTDDGVYRAFHDALVWAVTAQRAGQS